MDVYDRAGGGRAGSVFAHAVHLSERELARLVGAGAHVAHCPASNLFLASGVMPLARYRSAGLSVGLGSDVAAGPEVSIWSAMRVGAYAPERLAGHDGRSGHRRSGRSTGCGWPRSTARAHSASATTSDHLRTARRPTSCSWTRRSPRRCAGMPLPPADPGDEAQDIASRLIFRAHRGQVRAAWVRGRRLVGPGRSRRDLTEDLLIVGGRLVDGTGGPARPGSGRRGRTAAMRLIGPGQSQPIGRQRSMPTGCRRAGLHRPAQPRWARDPRGPPPRAEGPPGRHDARSSAWTATGMPRSRGRGSARLRRAQRGPRRQT